MGWNKAPETEINLNSQGVQIIVIEIIRWYLRNEKCGLLTRKKIV